MRVLTETPAGSHPGVNSRRSRPLEWQMTQVHLPAEHSDADLALAGAVAEQLALGELYVAWSQTAGNGRPVVAAAVREAARAPERRRPRSLARLLAAARGRLARLD